MNILLPLLLLFIAYMIPHLESANNILTDKGELYVAQVVANSPASRAGIQANDIILSANGQPLYNVGDYQKIVDANLGVEITLTLKHPDATTTEVKVTPEANAPASQGATGLALSTVVKKSYSFWQLFQHVWAAVHPGGGELGACL